MHTWNRPIKSCLLLVWVAVLMKQSPALRTPLRNKRRLKKATRSRCVGVQACSAIRPAFRRPRVLVEYGAGD